MKEWFGENLFWIGVFYILCGAFGTWTCLSRRPRIKWDAVDTTFATFFFTIGIGCIIGGLFA